MFKGSIVALITPFKNNMMDEDKYVSLIHHHITNGTKGVVPAGTTGESPTLSNEEHKRVIEIGEDLLSFFERRYRVVSTSIIFSLIFLLFISKLIIKSFIVFSKRK